MATKSIYGIRKDMFKKGPSRNMCVSIRPREEGPQLILDHCTGTIRSADRPGLDNKVRILSQEQPCLLVTPDPTRDEHPNRELHFKCGRVGPDGLGKGDCPGVLGIRGWEDAIVTRTEAAFFHAPCPYCHDPGPLVRPNHISLKVGTCQHCGQHFSIAGPFYKTPAELQEAYLAFAKLARSNTDANRSIPAMAYNDRTPWPPFMCPVCRSLHFRKRAAAWCVRMCWQRVLELAR